MSRQAAYIEEFDDDTDLPLPAHTLPNTGIHGALLEELHISDDEFQPPSSQAGPARQQRTEQSGDASRRITDTTPYKSWTCVYPIYLDAKRSYGTGERRVARAKSLWWPLSKDIADACHRLGLGTLHEVNKSHPRDWENPGRVRVQWKKEGKLFNPIIKTKKQLLEAICYQVQILKPENIPKPPYNLTPTATAEPPSSTKGGSLAIKGKQPAAAKSKTPTAPPKQSGGSRPLPVPPEPYPSLTSRVSQYSPAIASGILLETLKAAANPTEGVGALPGPATPGGSGKGKRKVVRVRA